MGESSQLAANLVAVNKFTASRGRHIRKATVPAIHEDFWDLELVFGDLQHFQIILNLTSDLYSYFSPPLGDSHLATKKIFVPLMLF